MHKFKCFLIFNKCIALCNPVCCQDVEYSHYTRKLPQASPQPILTPTIPRAATALIVLYHGLQVKPE